MAIYEMILMVVAAVNCLDIDPRGQDLTEVPSLIDSGVTTLNLQYNKIKGINSMSLILFQELAIFLLPYNEIQ